MRALIVPIAFAAALVAAAPASGQRMSLADRVAVLEQRAADNRGNVDLLNQLTELRREVQSLRSQVEELQQQNEQLKSTARSQYLDLDGRLNRLEGAGEDTGILELDFREPGACELTYFGVTAGLVGGGAARWMMNRAIERAWSAPISRFWVHTCTLDHPGAPAFYMRSGFKPFRRQVEIADDPRLLGLAAPQSAPHVPLIRPA